MNINISFQISGLVLLVVIMIMLARRRVLNITSFKRFSALLIGVFFTTCLDIASVFTINYLDYRVSIINNVVCRLYLISIVIVANLLLRYVVSQTGFESKVVRYIVNGNIALTGMYLVACPFSKVRYYLQDEKVYTYGTFVELTYAVSLIAVFISIVFTIKAYKKMNVSKRKSTIFMLAALCVATVIQLLNNEYLLVSYALCVAMVYIYMCMENPDDYIDKISGAFNLDAAHIVLEEQLKKRDDLNLITVEIKDIKFINETFGAVNGTRLLKSIADYLENISCGSVFRTTGAAYTLAVFDTNEKFMEIVSRIQDRFRYSWRISDVDTILPVNICVLPNNYMGLNITDRFEILQYYMSNEAMKENNGYFVVDNQAIEEKNKLEMIEASINRAIETDAVMVYYQPIFNNVKGYFTSAEALMRIKDFEGKFISPEIFIPIAEKNGLILRLGIIVFEKVCSFIEKNNLQNSKLEYIEVNLSVIQCMQHDLAERFLEVMKSHNVANSFINFEITETAASNSENTLLKNMKKLIENESSFSLDDYGSGYSNINYVLDLPISLLKYDKNMVWSYFSSEKGRVVMEYSVEMIKQLKMKSLAEGVETKEQFDEIKRMGIEYTQGFFFSKPLPEDEFVLKINEIVQI